MAESGGGFGSTVRAFAFDGDEVKYRSWEGKTLALASSKEFLLTLTRESTGTALTVEEFTYGEVEVKPAGMVTTTGGGAATAAVMWPSYDSRREPEVPGQGSSLDIFGRELYRQGICTYQKVQRGSVYGMVYPT